MATSSLESKIQGIVHALEQGSVMRYVQVLAATGLVIGLAVLFLFVNFRGFIEREAMEQAQVAREIAAGNGFSTKMIRPLAVWQLQRGGKELSANFPETYHAPLHPAVNSVALSLIKDHWKMPATEVVYAGERAIAGTAMVLFILSLAVWYVVGWRLFDHKIAILGTGLLVVCNLMWQFTLSGLPQMLMLFLLGCAVLCLVLAAEAKKNGTIIGLWLAAASVFFGLLALANGVAIWLFLGALAFIAVYFRPRILAVLLVIGIFAAVYSPWLVRNYSVTGSPFGLAPFAALEGVTFSAEGWMRQEVPEFGAIQAGNIRVHLQKNLLGQFNSLFENLGWSLVAPVFFLSLLHFFKDKVRADMRWCVLLMWLASVAGLTIFGTGDSPVQANQLHVLFLPLMIFYGLAMTLVLWSRLSINHPVIRAVFLSLIFLLSAIPLVIELLPGGKSRIQWPPYVPPFIAVFSDWFEPGEIIVSDMPWAVGWYAGRKALWLPKSPAVMTRIHDYNELGGPISGLYLTPVTGHLPFFPQIVRGEYNEWAAFILRSPNLQGFPLQVVTALPLDDESIIFTDRERWKMEDLAIGKKEDAEEAQDAVEVPPEE